MIIVCAEFAADVARIMSDHLGTKPGDMTTEQQCQMVAEASGWRNRALKAEEELRCQADLDAAAKPVPDGVVTEWHRDQFPSWVNDENQCEVVDVEDAAAVLAKHVPAPEPVRDLDLDRAKEIVAPILQGIPECRRAGVIGVVEKALKEGRGR